MDNAFLHERTLILLQETAPDTLTQATHQLAAYFTQITGIGIDDMVGNDIILPTGKAISPAKAAHCLKEYKRTKIFLRGIYDAINDKLQHKNVVQILYAGTGPYGTLITPLLTLFSPEQIRLHMLEINPVSMDALKTLYQHLEFEAYVDNYIVADACTYQLPADMDPDITISETMLAALKREPQVSVMQNLIPQLSKSAIFIPQQITVSALLTKWKSEMAYMAGEEDDPGRIFLKEIYAISQTSLPGEAESIVDIPQESTNNVLSLFTEITVYKDYLLTANDCSLNIPKQIISVKETPCSQIAFKYQIAENPGFRFSIINN